MRSLVLGVAGFAGQYLAADLAAAGHDVHGVARGPVDWHVPATGDVPAVSLLQADLTSATEARRAIEAVHPDHIYHLAARSSVAESLQDPLGVLHNNTAVVVSVLEAIRAVVPASRVLIVSSSEVYGRATGTAPIDERTELRPENPYAVSKAAQDLLGYQYHVAHGLDVVRVRPFNHVGPGQSDRFVTASFARQIAEIEAGQQESVLRVGNLSAQRDFTDVRDIVRAYRLALELGEAGAVYNLGRGEAVSIQWVLDILRAQSRAPVDVQVDPARLRSADAPLQLCDSSRFRARTGWEPRHLIETSLTELLEFWRARVGETHTSHSA